MPSAIEDVSSLPGETVCDQDGRKLGEVKEIYAVGERTTPMWVTVETTIGIGRTRRVFIPIARLKHEGDEIRTPYSFDHIQESPAVDGGDELSEEDERRLRSYYSVGLADQEIVAAARSYASQVPDEDGPARRADASEVQGRVRELDDRPTSERAEEADEAQDDREERKHTSAEDVLGGDGGDSGDEDNGDVGGD